jgi:hypothetical protein
MIFLLQDIFIPAGKNGVQPGPVSRQLRPDQADLLRGKRYYI